VKGAVDDDRLRFWQFRRNFVVAAAIRLDVATSCY
jgi:hypothetical protein